MRVPGGTEGRGAGEWWTSIADWRETRKIKIEGKEEGSGEGVLEKLAYDGDKFGTSSIVKVLCPLYSLIYLIRLRKSCFYYFVHRLFDGKCECTEIRRFTCSESELKSSEMERTAQ